MGVSPSTKETTLYHFRDPLPEIVSHDDELDLVGVTFLGSPDDNYSKLYMAGRLGMLAEALDVDGVIIHVEGYGNQHVDMSMQFEELGSRGIKAVALTFAGNGLVVFNQYMHDSIVDLEKTGLGMETGVVCQNTVMPADVFKALRILKKKLNKPNLEY